MPIPLKDRKAGIVSYVLKRVKGSNCYDKMKEDNEYGPTSHKLVAQTDEESDYKTGMKQSIEGLMSAVESKDAMSFEKHLKSFFNMMMEESEEDKKMMMED